MRTVTLRDDTDGANHRSLWAYLDEGGDLHIDGQDLGPMTAVVSTDGEYEWGRVIRAGDIPRLAHLLEAQPDQDILDLLEHSWSGRMAGHLEELIRTSDIEARFWVWTG
jgi:hypothetical protein